ncbi:MAG TPA: CDP-diacylglycerol--glycerol-3-phosphate 3-phosphatidyltransferase [Candidatus Rifleibacterium sp.]|jgi:CDP-diacylglycerol--glycerol-3-phosphate 3-phosphatidyltransferase|nr:CDP-diacylglycerol--glycerol-3-phosphate 3-phosphatidyltransferase [Candidatus Rifleibacterium sp.]HPW57776.1 CDP-diacylglycerol--glycerol-3-phosphate 3-phosphatidyltransferase [Candidatus Rifleibacterium sp.]
MTLATKLTLMRVAAIPFFMLAFFFRAPGAPLEGDWGKALATLIFIIAAITDYYDGYLARLYKEVTTFGRFIDPIADKLLVSTALIAMVEYREITHTAAWVAIIIIAREFAVTGLRLICAERGQVIDASGAGKIKTTFQLTAIITTLCFLTIRVFLLSYNQQAYLEMLMKIYSPVIQGLMILAALATVYSGYDYFKKNWHFLD